jgi:S1-C subfamily serine protease
MDEERWDRMEYQGGGQGVQPPQSPQPPQPPQPPQVRPETEVCEGPPGGGNWVSWCRTKVKSVGWVKVTAAAVIAALVVLIALPAIFGVNPYDLVRGKLRGGGSQTRIVVSPASNTAVITVANKVSKSVVNIDIREAPPPNTTTATPTTGSASGVIYRSDGIILTNNHVVGAATSIVVTLSDGKKYPGTRVGTDPASDLAVVKIDATNLPAIAVGNSDSLVVGQLVVAIGNSLGFQQTVTSGIVSALHRSVQEQTDSGATTKLDGLIQTDAPINPGNSGGALCDASSKLVGITAVIATQSGGSQGIAFAIPVNTAVRVANGIIGRNAAAARARASVK